jgi:DNA-binding transcriptional ArsR family regulator
MDITIPSERTAAQPKEALLAVKPKFTRIPKVPELIAQGVPTEAIPTYCALADHANNKTGLCWPKMETLAIILNRSVRTVQRHLHQLRECGLIEFVSRRRYKGRYSSYLYKVLHIPTTGQGKRVDKGAPIKRRTKPSLNTPKPPKKDVKDSYWWFFGEEAPAGAQEEHNRKEKERGEKETNRSKADYEWFFA